MPLMYVILQTSIGGHAVHSNQHNCTVCTFIYQE